MGTVAIIVFFLTGVFLILIANTLSNLLSHKSSNPQKYEPYESGVKTIGTTWIRYKIGYYLFALIFLIFDVEIVFLVPWSVVFKKMGAVALIDIIIFLVILGLGLIYALKKRALKWV